MSATLSPENQIGAKLTALGLSLNRFAPLAGVSVPTLSRWLSTQHIPRLHAESLLDLLATIEDLYKKLYPIRPDLNDPNAVFMLRKLRMGRLIVHPVVDADPDNSKTKEELEAIRNEYKAGLEALSRSILNEPVETSAIAVESQGLGNVNEPHAN